MTEKVMDIDPLPTLNIDTLSFLEPTWFKIDGRDMKKVGVCMESKVNSSKSIQGGWKKNEVFLFNRVSNMLVQMECSYETSKSPKVGLIA